MSWVGSRVVGSTASEKVRMRVSVSRLKSKERSMGGVLSIVTAEALRAADVGIVTSLFPLVSLKAVVVTDM